MNGFSFPNYSYFNIYIILILLLSMMITFIFKNTNYLIENFNSYNFEKEKD